MSKLDYEMDVTPDESALDVEWLTQPALAAKYGRIAAQAKDRMDRAKERLDLEKATLDKKIRDVPEDFDISKPTEAVVQNTIIRQSSYQEALSEYLDEKHEYDMAMVAVRAVETKKSALENLVKLHGMSYFAGPSIPRDLTKEWENSQRVKKTDEGVARVLRRTRK